MKFLKGVVSNITNIVCGMDQLYEHVISLDFVKPIAGMLSSD